MVFNKDSVRRINTNAPREVESCPVQSGLTRGLTGLPRAPVGDAGTHAGPHGDLAGPVAMLALVVGEELGAVDGYVVVEIAPCDLRAPHWKREFTGISDSDPFPPNVQMPLSAS
ncbi:hypothetical protein GCM10010260_81540 [Streptomyces filipinensis]|uniref:Uncharacterized protein n=1 Tax=Streptomyces filipinensis TaxID=66887 RepID=A0A918MGG2_9ACTN|nr:hypothetical protein GCM10010260_81540 [Streptomyces filipinensis]